MTEVIEFLVHYLPQYIKYIYPGYITIYIYYFLRAKTLADTKGNILKAIIISYIYVSSLTKFRFTSQLQENFWLIIVSIVVAYTCYIATKSNYLLKVFDFLKIDTTFYNNEIEALQGQNEGVWLTVYLKEDEVVYEGFLHYKEMENGKRKYITLSGYRKYVFNKNGTDGNICIEDNANNNEEEVMIFYDSIKRIEKREVKMFQE